MQTFDYDALLRATHCNCTFTYQNFHETAIPAREGKLNTNTTYGKNNFGYLPYLCITCPLSQLSHFIYSHTNIISSGERWDYLSVFLNSAMLWSIRIWLLTGLDVMLTSTADKCNHWSAREAVGPSCREHPHPSNLLTRAPFFWSKGSLVHRLSKLEAIVQLNLTCVIV